MKKFVIPYVAKIRSSIFFIVFDKPAYQSLAKAFTQKLRNGFDDRTIGYLKLIDKDLSSIFDNSIPDWRLVRKSRDLRYELVYSICKFWDKNWEKISVTLGIGQVQIVVDGWKRHFTSNPTEPLLLKHRDNLSNIEINTFIFSNTHPEADQAIPFIVGRCISINLSEMFLVLTNDTDIFLCSLLNFRSFNKNTKFLIDYFTPSWKSCEMVYSIDFLWRKVSENPELEPIQFKPESLVVSLICAGASDYTYGFRFVSLKNLFDALHFSYKNDLVKLNGSNLHSPLVIKKELLPELCKWAFIHAHVSIFKNEKVSRISKNVKEWTVKPTLNLFLNHFKIQCPSNSKKSEKVKAVTAYLGQNPDSLQAFLNLAEENRPNELSLDEVRTRIWVECAANKWVPSEDCLNKKISKDLLTFVIFASPISRFSPPISPLDYGFRLKSGTSAVIARNIVIDFGNNTLMSGKTSGTHTKSV